MAAVWLESPGWATLGCGLFVAGLAVLSVLVWRAVRASRRRRYGPSHRGDVSFRRGRWPQDGER